MYLQPQDYPTTQRVKIIKELESLGYDDAVIGNFMGGVTAQAIRYHRVRYIDKTWVNRYGAHGVYATEARRRAYQRKVKGFPGDIYDVWLED